MQLLHFCCTFVALKWMAPREGQYHDQKFRLSFGEVTDDPARAARWFYLLRVAELVPEILSDLKTTFERCEPLSFNGYEYASLETQATIRAWCEKHNFVAGVQGPPEWILHVVADTIAQMQKFTGAAFEGWCLPGGSGLTPIEIDGTRWLPDVQRIEAASAHLPYRAARKFKAGAVAAIKNKLPAGWRTRSRWAPEHFDFLVLRQHLNWSNEKIADHFAVKGVREKAQAVHKALRGLRKLVGLTRPLGRPRSRRA